ncbi:MAG: phosphopantetheine-binding protein [Burkholderiaceae bacterium]
MAALQSTPAMSFPIEQPRTAADPRVGAILDIVAHEAKIERDQLRLEASTDELGIGSLDLTLIVFEIEAHFGVELPLAPEPPADRAMTVGMLVDQVLRLLDAQAARPASA